MNLWRRLSMGLVSLLLVAGTVMPLRVQAAGCVANISPSTVTPGASLGYSIEVVNHTGSDIQWIDITVPDDFTYQSNSVGSWTVADHAGGITLNDGTLQEGDSEYMSVSAQANLLLPADAAWTIRAANDNGGAGAVTCTGNTSTAIDGHPPNDNDSGVQNIMATSITKTSATVTWATDSPASSIVYYGTTDEYGSHAGYNATESLSHQASLTGLTPDTTYHFMVAGFDDDGNLVHSADGTFLTQSSIVPGSGSGGGTSSSNTSNAGRTGAAARVPINPAAATDKTPPAIIVNTKLTGAYKVAPVISGSATDNVALALVEYSTDGGKNWLPAEDQQGLGTTKITYRALLPPLQDGNYDLILRAVDQGGNIVNAPLQVLVIDRLSPIVGASVVNIGPQTVYPDTFGRITALQEADQKVTLSAVGGPIAITISAVPTDKTKAANTFSLTKSPDSGLWTGTMDFKHAGDFELSVIALDGAGNRTTRPFFKAHVLPLAPVYRHKTDTKLQATATLYYRDPETGRWVLWDAAAYVQENPQATNGTGYGFYVPNGTYYIKYQAAGYQTQISQSITVDSPSVLTQDIYLKRRPGIYTSKVSLSLPWISFTQAPYEQSVSSKVRPSQTALPELANFSLPQTNQQTLSYPQLFGKPTIMTFINSWAPASQDQLRVLATINNPDIRIMPVSAGESASRAAVYGVLSDYPLPIVVDSDNRLVQNLVVSSVPSHYFVDRHGVVKKVMVGLLSKEELLNNLQN